METLRLDSDIRNWVLIPITVAMFLVGVLRHNFAKLLRSDAKVDLKALREAQAVIRAERIRNNAGYMQAGGFRQRRFFFCNKVSMKRDIFIHLISSSFGTRLRLLLLLLLTSPPQKKYKKVQANNKQPSCRSPPTRTQP